MSDSIPPPAPYTAHSPFRPGFGTTPPALVGRQEYINSFARSLDGPAGTPGRAVFVTGQRGMGKTVLLNVFEEVAHTRQWLSVREQASPGFATRLTNSRIPEVLEAHDAHITVNASTVGFSLPFAGGGITRRTESTSALIPDFRSHLMKALELLDQYNTGLLISLDEVHRTNIDELRVITDSVAYAFSQQAPLAIVIAGLPWSINDIVNDDISTFLRRADRITLHNLVPDNTAAALREPIEEAGKFIDSAALHHAIQATFGYPYLVQVLGHLAWTAAKDAQTITTEHVSAAVPEAQSILDRQIYEPTLAKLTPRQRDYIFAMSQQTQPVESADISSHLRLSKQATNNLRRQLIDLGVIVSPRRGYVDFTLPYMRDFLRTREH